KVSILSEHHFSQHVVAQELRTKDLLKNEWVHDVAAGFRHLDVLRQPPSVSENRFGCLESGGHQERRPIHRVKPQNVFTDEMGVDRPIFGELRVVSLETDSTQIPVQSVEPHIEYVGRIVG